jgi:hypothetical protein
MFEGYIASEIYKDSLPRRTRAASFAWRFRNKRTKASQIATAVITSLVSLFVR